MNYDFWPTSTGNSIHLTDLPDYYLVSILKDIKAGVFHPVNRNDWFAALRQEASRRGLVWEETTPTIPFPPNPSPRDQLLAEWDEADNPFARWAVATFRLGDGDQNKFGFLEKPSSNDLVFLVDELNRLRIDLVALDGPPKEEPPTEQSVVEMVRRWLKLSTYAKKQVEAAKNLAGIILSYCDPERDGLDLHWPIIVDNTLIQRGDRTTILEAKPCSNLTAKS